VRAAGALMAGEVTTDERVNELVNQLGELLETRVLALITFSANEEPGLVCPLAVREGVVALLQEMDWSEFLEDGDGEAG
jgi:predicted pyridoxine 5'-phosphate oxidase superfamily flavin-nucleotide-binding protein